MATLTVSAERVLELARKLPSEDLEQVVDVLKRETAQRLWREVQTEGAARIGQVAAARGQDWDAMSDEDRDRFVEDLLDED